MPVPIRNILCKCGKGVMLLLVSVGLPEVFEGRCACGIRYEIYWSPVLKCSCGKYAHLQLTSTERPARYEGKCVCGVYWEMSRLEEFQ